MPMVARKTDALDVLLVHEERSKDGSFIEVYALGAREVHEPVKVLSCLDVVPMHEDHRLLDMSIVVRKGACPTVPNFGVLVVQIVVAIFVGFQRALFSLICLLLPVAVAIVAPRMSVARNHNAREAHKYQ